jgi:hypothetical protein
MDGAFWHRGEMEGRRPWPVYILAQHRELPRLQSSMSNQSDFGINIAKSKEELTTCGLYVILKFSQTRVIWAKQRACRVSGKHAGVVDFRRTPVRNAFLQSVRRLKYEQLGKVHSMVWRMLSIEPRVGLADIARVGDGQVV